MKEKELKSLVERRAQIRKELADLDAKIAKHLASLTSPQQQQQPQPPKKTPPSN